MVVQDHPRSLILVPIKSACDFLLVINSNLCPVLPHFRDIARFLLRTVTPLLFQQNFGSVPIRLDCHCCGPRSEDPKLCALHGIATVRSPFVRLSVRDVDVQWSYRLG